MSPRTQTRSQCVAMACMARRSRCWSKVQLGRHTPSLSLSNGTKCLLVARRHARATGREKPGHEHARLRGPAECLAHCASQHVKVSPSLKTFRNVHFARLPQSLTSLWCQVLISRISERKTVQLWESRVRSANHLVSKGCRCHHEQSELKVHLFRASPRHVPDAFQG